MDKIIIYAVPGAVRKGKRQIYGMSPDAQGVGGVILGTAHDCPYCSRPEGWDACPVHRDGQ